MSLQLAATSYIYIYYDLKKKRNARRWWQMQLYISREVYSGSRLLADLNFQVGSVLASGDSYVSLRYLFKICFLILLKCIGCFGSHIISFVL
jgi:hypothetical protein